MKLSVQIRLFPKYKITLIKIDSLQVGFEPTSLWLTAIRSTTELLKKQIKIYRAINDNILLKCLHLVEMESELKNLCLQCFHQKEFEKF
jgi:hypothetical protein